MQGVDMTSANIVDYDISQAFPSDGTSPVPDAKLTCMRELHRHYIQFFVAPAQSPQQGDWIASERIARIEREWNRYEESRTVSATADLPTTAKEFQDWFAVVSENNEYPDVCDYIRNDASLLDIALLVLAEGKVEGYFDDLMALAQVGLPSEAKMTIARNYWDEMGNGNYNDVHTTMLDRTTGWMREYAVSQKVDFGILEFPEAYTNACQLLMYCLRRRYLLRGLAGLGLLEQTAPARFAATIVGLKRLGVPKDIYRYESVHVDVDRRHSHEWVDGVFSSIIKENPDTIPELATGVLIRGNIAKDFFDKVKQDIFRIG
jgi:Iron-containing redox enzyme